MLHREKCLEIDLNVQRAISFRLLCYTREEELDRVELSKFSSSVHNSQNITLS